jgi:hypothetical protein
MDTGLPHTPGIVLVAGGEKGRKTAIACAKGERRTFFLANT